MDIVYTVKYADRNEELTYSLRSLANVPHGRVYFVGGCPEGINTKKIEHVPVPALNSKYDTTTNNLYEICKLEELSDNFIWMNDDFFILQKVADPIKEFRLHKGYINSNILDYRERNGGKLSKYMTGVENTYRYLVDRGVRVPLDYELHIPCVYNKYNVRSMFNLPGIFTVPMLQPRSVYGNLYSKSLTEVRDCKILRKTVVDYNELSTRKFLSCSDETWIKIKEFLSVRFKDKCEYEI